MKNTTKRIVVLTSGGDAPGMNAAIRAVVRRATYSNIEVFGSQNGYAGLIDNTLIPLNARSVANCIQCSGTLLKTKRVHEFHDPEVRNICRDFLRKNRIDSLIVLGGNGSFTGARLLSENEGPKVIGIPCTIDNDINGTEYCIGFDTACNTAINAVDNIRNTALSLNQNFLIEVMGRSSGFIAAKVGLAVGAEFILIPEFPIKLPELSTSIKARSGIKMASIIIAAESGQPGRCFKLAHEIKQLTGIHYSVCVLGHTQRGGTPTAKDRVTASMMGAKAVEALLAGQANVMLVERSGKILTAPFNPPEKATRYFSDNKELQLNQILCH